MRLANRAFTAVLPKRAAMRVVVVLVAAMLSGCAGLDKDAATPPKGAGMAPRLMELTEQAIAEARYSDAERLLVQLSVVEPKNPISPVLLAELHLATGLLDQSITEFDGLKDAPQVSARAMQGKGIALLLRGESEAAFKALQTAVQKDAGLWRAWNALGYYHDTLRNWAESAQCYQSALSANPNSALVYNNRGFSLLLQGRLPEAVADLTRAAELDPSLTEAGRNLRLALALNGEYSRAIFGVSGTGLSEALNNVGYVALLRGDYTAAEAYLLRAMEADASYNRIASRNLNYLKSIKEVSGGNRK